MIEQTSFPSNVSSDTLAGATDGESSASVVPSSATSYRAKQTTADAVQPESREDQAMEPRGAIFHLPPMNFLHTSQLDMLWKKGLLTRVRF